MKRLLLTSTILLTSSSFAASYKHFDTTALPTVAPNIHFSNWAKQQPNDLATVNFTVSKVGTSDIAGEGGGFPHPLNTLNSQYINQMGPLNHASFFAFNYSKGGFPATLKFTLSVNDTNTGHTAFTCSKSKFINKLPTSVIYELKITSVQPATCQLVTESIA